MIKDLWLRVGGPNAVSFLVWIATSPIAVFGFYFAYWRDIPEGQEPLLFLVSVVSYFPYGAVLGFAWLTYLSPKTNRRSRPKIAIVTFFAAGFSTGMCFSLLVDLTGLQENPDYIAISATRALIAVYWACLMALVMDSHRRFALQASELTKAITSAEAIAKHRVKAVDQLRVDLIEKVRSTISLALNVKNRTDLDVAADQIVRPLVEALRSRGALIADQNPLITKKLSIRPIVFEALANPSLPMLVGVLASMANLVASVRWLAPATLLNLLVLSLVISLTLGLIRALKPGKFLLITLYALGAIATVVSGEFFQQFAPESARTLANLNIGSWLVAIFIGSFIKFEQKRVQVLEQLRATLDELKWNQDRLQQELWVERNRLVRYVHGNIQSKIRAAAARSGDLTPVQLERLKEDCLSMLDFEASPISFEEFLDQTRRVWEGILELGCQLEPGMLKILEQDSFANTAVIETVREGVLNAVRHGEAKSAHLRLWLLENPKGPILKLELENDGKPINKRSDSGFGSTVLDQSTSFWQLENRPTGVVLSAEIPVTIVTEFSVSSAQ